VNKLARPGIFAIDDFLAEQAEAEARLVARLIDHFRDKQIGDQAARHLQGIDALAVWQTGASLRQILPVREELLQSPVTMASHLLPQVTQQVNVTLAQNQRFDDGVIAASIGPDLIGHVLTVMAAVTGGG
jgi:hypothetical protein